MRERIHALADRLADHPVVFHYLRKLPEWNYGATKARIRALSRKLGTPRVLDAGCGTGEFSDLFDPARYLGIDVHPGYVAYARRRRPDHRYACEDLVHWAGNGEHFDLVLVNGVLHHLDDDTARALLRSVVAHLSDTGTLLVIEDTDIREAGLGTRLVHSLDHGHFIRDAVRWQELVGEIMPIVRSETYRSGICPYHLMVCARS